MNFFLKIDDHKKIIKSCDSVEDSKDFMIKQNDIDCEFVESIYNEQKIAKMVQEKTTNLIISCYNNYVEIFIHTRSFCSIDCLQLPIDKPPEVNQVIKFLNNLVLA